MLRTTGAGSGVEQQDQPAAVQFATDLGVGKTLLNNGIIDASLMVEDTNYGIRVTRNLAGTLTNAGAIRAGSANQTGQWVKAYGIYIDGDLSGTLTKNRNMSASAANSAGQGLAVADGIYSVLSGNFSKVTDNSALFDFRSLAINSGEGGRIDLEIVKSQSTSASQAAISNGNSPALGAARVFDRLIAGGNAGGDMGTVITALGQLGSEREVSNAVSQTLPLLTAGASQATSGALHGTNRVVQARQEGQHGRSSGDEFFTDRRVWARPLGSWADQADSNGASGYTARTYGMVVGADTGLNESSRLGVAVAHTLALGERTSFTPSLRADYAVIRDQGYRETGADALNLNVDSNRAEELIVGVDGKLSQILNERTTLVANIGAGYDFLGKQSSIVAAFAGTPSAAFTTKGIEPSKWLGRGGLGLVNRVNDTLELSARYDIEFREGFTNQTASVKARWMF